MAHIRKRGDRWGVCIRRLGIKEFKSFDTLEEAERWADIEERSIVLENERKKRKPRDDERQLEFASSADIVLSGVRFHNGPGVYVLLEGEVITYVGKARNAIARILAHSKNGRRFTHYVIVPCEEVRLTELENRMIWRLRPTENKTLSQGRPKALKSRASSSERFLSGGRPEGSAITLQSDAREPERMQSYAERPTDGPRLGPCPLTRRDRSTGVCASG